MHRCDECGSVYHYAYQAEECCPPTTSLVYECSLCAKAHDEESHAEYCCQLLNHDNEPTGLTPAALEALGQQRLELV
jgi:hypothetical protein